MIKISDFLIIGIDKKLFMLIRYRIIHHMYLFCPSIAAKLITLIIITLKFSSRNIGIMGIKIDKPSKKGKFSILVDPLNG